MAVSESSRSESTTHEMRGSVKQQRQDSADLRQEGIGETHDVQTWATWISSSAAIGLLANLSHMRKFRYLPIFVGIGDVVGSEYTPIPIYTPAENLKVDKVADITSGTKDWDSGNVAKQVPIWRFTAVLLWGRWAELRPRLTQDVESARDTKWHAGWNRPAT